LAGVVEFRVHHRRRCQAGVDIVTDGLTDEERELVKGMPAHVAAGFIAARRNKEHSTWDELRAKLDDIGMDVAGGDPVKGQRIAAFNDMLIDEFKRQGKK
jgi:hypothetical protein